MTVFKWTVTQLDRLTSNGFVFQALFNVVATEDVYVAQMSSAACWNQDMSPTFIPYEDLTEDEVLGWVQTTVGKDSTEASLQVQIDQLKNPTQAAGVPWTTPTTLEL